MTELEYKAALMCNANGASLAYLQNVRFLVKISFGLASPKTLLAGGVGFFYYIPVLNFQAATMTGRALLKVPTNSGQGSAGDTYIVLQNGANGTQVFRDIQCDSMEYNVDTFSAGSLYLQGQVFKVFFNTIV